MYEGYTYEVKHDTMNGSPMFPEWKWDDIPSDEIERA